MENTKGFMEYSKRHNGNFCLNGIAYHKKRDTLILTGKKWPFLYEINILKI